MKKEFDPEFIYEQLREVEREYARVTREYQDKIGELRQKYTSLQGKISNRGVISRYENWNEKDS